MDPLFFGVLIRIINLCIERHVTALRAWRRASKQWLSQAFPPNSTILLVLGYITLTKMEGWLVRENMESLLRLLWGWGKKILASSLVTHVASISEFLLTSNVL